MSLREAAHRMNLSEDEVLGLVRAGRLRPVGRNEVSVADVRAYVNNASTGGPRAADIPTAESQPHPQSLPRSTTVAGPSQQPPVDPQELLDALDGEVDDLAHRAYELFARAIPDALQWDDNQRALFIDQARGRFGAILAVAVQGAEVDDSLRADLEIVGANAAAAGTSLPNLLLVLRISRDLLVRAAIRLADDNNRWMPLIGGFTTRVAPAIDRLSDALTDGYWMARVREIRDNYGQLDSLISGIPYGVYEVDMDGRILYSNTALASLVGMVQADMSGLPLSEVFDPIGGSGSVSALLSEPPEDVAHISFSVKSAGDGDPITLDVDTVVRRNGVGAIQGFAGIVRIATPTAAPVDLTPLIRHIYELRRSLDILGDAGEFLSRHASQMDTEKIVAAGESVKLQAERLLLIVSELDSDRVALQPPT